MPHNVWRVARRDWLAYVGMRRFWISVTLMPLLLLLVILLPALIHDFAGTERYAVIDHSGWLLPALTREIEAHDVEEILIRLRHPSTRPARGALPAFLLHWIAPLKSFPNRDLGPLAQALAGLRPPLAAARHTSIWRDRRRLLAWYRALTPRKAALIDRHLDAARFERVGVFAETPARLRSAILRGSLAGYFVFGSSPLSNPRGFRFVTRNLTATGLETWMDRLINRAIRSRKISKLGLSTTEARWLATPIVFHDELVTRHGARSVTGAERVAQWLPIGYVWLLYIAIITISQTIMMSTITEKSNRIAEALLSRLTAAEIMRGKIIAGLAVGLTMVSAWVLFLAAALGYAESRGLGGPLLLDTLAAIHTGNVIWFFVFFFLGYLFYGALFGAIGASVGSVQQAQPYAVAATLLMVIPIVLVGSIVKHPHSLMARVLSFLPPFTPFVIMGRLAASPSIFELGSAALVLLLSAAAALYWTGRLFQNHFLGGGDVTKKS